MMMDTSLAPATSEDLIYQLAAPTAKPASGAPCFAARLSGLAVSRDAGKTWQPAYASLGLRQDLPTLSVAVASLAETECVVFAGYNGGVLRSLDGGHTWETSAFRAPAPAVSALAVSPNFAADGLVFAGTLADGIYYSANGGAQWHSGNLGLIDVNIFCLGLSPALAADQTLFAGTQSGLFCSRTAGRSWREVSLPGDYDAVISLALSPAFAADSTLYAGTEAHGLLVSQDAGSSWRRVGESALSGAINQVVLGPDFARRPRLLALHDGRLSASDDGGASWQPWQPRGLGDEPVVAVLAPQGFGPGRVVWVALESGRVARVRG